MSSDNFCDTFLCPPPPHVVLSLFDLSVIDYHPELNDRIRHMALDYEGGYIVGGRHWTMKGSTGDSLDISFDHTGLYQIYVP